MVKPLDVFRPGACGVSYDGTTLPGACNDPQGHDGQHSNFVPLPQIDGLNGWTPCFTNFTDPTGCLRVCWRPSGHIAFASDCATHWGPTYNSNECGIPRGIRTTGEKIRCTKPFAHEGDHDSFLAAAHKIATLPENIQPNPEPAMISVATPPDSFPPREDLLNEFGDPVNACPSALHLHGTIHPCDHVAGHTSPFHSNADAGAFWN